jgi:hypothetical protein
MQIDFGERLVEIGAVKLRFYLFVAILGYSRRCHTAGELVKAPMVDAGKKYLARPLSSPPGLL